MFSAFQEKPPIRDRSECTSDPLAAMAWAQSRAACANADEWFTAPRPFAARAEFTSETWLEAAPKSAYGAIVVVVDGGGGGGGGTVVEGAVVGGAVAGGASGTVGAGEGAASGTVVVVVVVNVVVVEDVVVLDVVVEDVVELVVDDEVEVDVTVASGSGSAPCLNIPAMTSPTRETIAKGAAKATSRAGIGGQRTARLRLPDGLDQPAGGSVVSVVGSAPPFFFWPGGVHLSSFLA